MLYQLSYAPRRDARVCTRPAPPRQLENARAVRRAASDLPRTGTRPRTRVGAARSPVCGEASKPLAAPHAASALTRGLQTESLDPPSLGSLPPARSRPAGAA